MVLMNHKQAVGVFPDYQTVEQALRDLQASGFPMYRVSVIAQDVSGRTWFPGIDVRDRFDHTRYGLPQERTSFYHDRLTRGHYLVMVEGTEDEIRRAETILSRRGIQEWGVYDVPDASHNIAGAGRQRRAVGVFPNRRDAEHALHELRDSGFRMDRVSIIVKDADRNDEIAGAAVRDRVDNKAEEGAAVGALSGGVLGGLTGLFVGLGTLAIPGIGPIMLAGAAATTIATTLAGTAIGAVAGTLLGALIGLGIPEERARVYSERVARGEYLVIVDGTDEEIAKAEAILSRSGIEEYGVYDAPYVVDVPKTDTTTGSVVPAAGLTRNKYAVGFFPHLRDAEHAVSDLRNAGFPLSQVSLIAQHFERQEPFADIDLRDRLDAMRMGLPDDRARFYNERVIGGDYIVVVNGTEDEIRDAAMILSNRGIREWQVYDPTTIDSTSLNDPVTVNQAVTSSGLGRHKRAVGFFPNRLDAELAINELRDTGFPVSQISLIAQNFERRGPFVDLDVRDRFDNHRFGFPEERARFFGNRVERGDYLVLVHGTDNEIATAQAILNHRGIQEFGIYDAPDFAPTGVDYDTPVVAATPSTIPDRAFAGHKRAIGAFPHRRDAEVALADLRDSGFSMNRVSVIAKDADRPIAGVDTNPRTGNKVDEGAKAGAATGGALGGLGGLLVGLGALAIPGIGPVMLGGAAATAIATAISGGAIGAAAGGLVGALAGLGIPEDRARVYNDRLARGDYLVIVDGTEDEVRRAEAILKRHGIQEFDSYDASDIDSPRSNFSRVDRDHTPGAYTRGSDRPMDSHPDVTIIDRREQTL